MPNCSGIVGLNYKWGSLTRPQKVKTAICVCLDIFIFDLTKQPLFCVKSSHSYAKAESPIQLE